MVQFKKSKINLDYAIIATPSHLHFKYAEFFLKKKVNVLIEKPMVLRLDHARKLINLTKKKKVKCWVALQNRYNKAIQKLKKDVENKSDKISLIDCSLLWSRSEEYYKTGWKGKYRTDGGVLANQGIHLLDALIYIFGPIKKFNVLAGYNKKKLQAEDIILLNFIHKNNLYSSFKATTRANEDYRSAIDVISEKGRKIVKGISLNTYNIFKNGNLMVDKKNSEIFKLGLGPVSGMGNGHQKILDEFTNTNIKNSSKNIEIQNNYYLLDLMHSIYNAVFQNKLHTIKGKQSIWGK